MVCTNGQGWSPSGSPYCIPICGKPVYKSARHWSRARLFGGALAEPHSWPWQVAIEVTICNL